MSSVAAFTIRTGGQGRRLGRLIAATAVLWFSTFSAAFADRPIRPGDINVPDGFSIRAVVKDLAAPTMVAFDDQGRMLIAESGYCGDPDHCPDGGGVPKVTRIEKNGKKTVLARGKAFGSELPVTSVAFNDGKIYVAHGGTISTVEPGGTLKDIITGLPGQGDHQTNQILFKDGFMYVTIGTATNSAVVGPDNAVFGWLKKPNLRQLHDVPCADVTVTGQTFESENPLRGEPNVIMPLGQPGSVTTGAYSAFGTTLAPGQVVKGDPKCNGAVLRANPDGSGLSVYAWGFRNPYGLETGADGNLYVTMHGFDARGSRPIENAWDCFYRVQQGAWYGWPDFACDRPVTDSRFKPQDKPQPQFVLQSHPTENPPAPIAKFNPHAATNGFAFASSYDWGPPSVAYIALFGDFTPATGTVSRPKGVKIVRLDTRSGRVSDFITNDFPGQASRHNAGGLEHPSDVTFGPDRAMYIADWGVARVSVEGLKLERNTGVVWKVTRGGAGGFELGPSFTFSFIGALILAALAFAGVAGKNRSRRAVDGAWTGAVAGLVMGLFTMAVASPVLKLPWYAPPRVLATMVMGRNAVANILEFRFAPFIVGTLVLVVITVVLGLIYAAAIHTPSRGRIVIGGVLLGLLVWTVMQYFVFPAFFPLVTEKGFPPGWYAASFALFGLVLGLLLALAAKDKSQA